MRTASLILFLSALLGAAHTARAGTPLLAGRLTIDLPSGMKVEPSHWSLDELGSTVDQARAELPFEDGRFVMTATETYRRASPNLRADVLAELKRQGGALARSTVETITLGDDFDAVVVRPPLPAKISDANLVFALYLAPTQDRAIQIVAFYVVGSARGNPGEWAARAETIAGTAHVSGGSLTGYAGLLGVANHRIRIQCQHDCLIRPSGERYELRLLVPLHEEAACRIEAASSSDAPRTWTDRAGRHARWFIPIAGSAERIRVECDATTAANMASLRERFKTLVVEDSHAAFVPSEALPIVRADLGPLEPGPLFLSRAPERGYGCIVP